MLTRRNLLAATSALPGLAAARGTMFLCMHQTTSAGATFRASLEGYARAGIQTVELTLPVVNEFVNRESAAAAKRLIADLGLTAVSCGSVRGLAEPQADRPRALEDLKRMSTLAAELGIPRVVCPCGPSEKFTTEDYSRGVDNLREVGELVKPLGITAMLEFMRASSF